MDIEKQWAIGLSQIDFERAYLNKYPMADVIPDVNEWLVFKNGKPDLMIDGVLEYEAIDGEVKNKQNDSISHEPPVYACSKCGKKYEVPIAKTAHERFCKVKKVEGGNG